MEAPAPPAPPAAAAVPAAAPPLMELICFANLATESDIAEDEQAAIAFDEGHHHRGGQRILCQAVRVLPAAADPSPADKSDRPKLKFDFEIDVPSGIVSPSKACLRGAGFFVNGC